MTIASSFLGTILGFNVDFLQFLIAAIALLGPIFVYLVRLEMQTRIDNAVRKVELAQERRSLKTRAVFTKYRTQLLRQGAALDFISKQLYDVYCDFNEMANSNNFKRRDRRMTSYTTWRSGGNIDFDSQEIELLEGEEAVED